MARLTRTVTTLVLAAVLGGCYVHRPVSLDTVQPETHVRVTVGSGYDEDLALALRDQSRTFSARYVGEQNGGMTFAVPLVGPALAASARPMYNHITVQPADVTAVEVRELSRLRTAAVAVAGAVALSFIGVEAFGGDDDSQPKEDPGEDLFRPLQLRIPIGW